MHTHTTYKIIQIPESRLSLYTIPSLHTLSSDINFIFHGSTFYFLTFLHLSLVIFQLLPDYVKVKNWQKIHKACFYTCIVLWEVLT